MEHKKQHFIPQTYLKAWCDPATPPGQDPYVWQFTKDGAHSRRKPPKKIFFQKDMYTIRGADGTRDLRLEHGLAELEGKFTDVRSKLVGGQLLDETDHLVLVTFVAALHARTPAQVNHNRGQWNQVLDMMQDMQRSIDENPKNARQYAGIPGRGPSIGMDDVRRLVDHTVEHTLASEIDTMVPVLLGMDAALFTTDDEVGFMTSDAPVVAFDPEAYLRRWPLNAVGLGWPKIEVTCPISPSHLIMFNRQGLSVGMVTPPALLDEVNRRTRFHANEYYVVKSNSRRDHWFARIEPPNHGLESAPSDSAED